MGDILIYARRRLRRLVTSGRLWPDRLVSNFRHDPVEDPFQKYLAEYALFLMLALRSGQLDSDAAVAARQVALELQLLTSNARGHFRLRASPYASCSTVGFTLTVLETLTDRHDHLTDLLRREHQTHAHAHYAYATLARHRWLRLLLGLPEEPGHAAERTVLHRLLTAGEHPLYMSADQLYEITHVAFFLGDFGRHPTLSSEEKRPAAALLDAALARTIATADADLVAEVVMTQLSLQLPLTEYSREAIGYLEHLFATRGLTRLTPEEEEARVRKADDSENPEGEMLYHLILVFGMLQAMLATLPPRAVADPTSRLPEGLRLRAVSALAQAESWLSRTDGQRSGVSARCEPPDAWLAEYLPGSVRAWLTASGPDASGDGPRRRLVLDAVLIRALLHYDLPALARALATADELGVAATRTRTEALEALLRQQLPSGAFGGLVGVDGARYYGESAETTALVTQELRRFV